MENIHSLLKRQLKRCFGDAGSIPSASREFVQAVNEAYRAFDVDREMLERALDLSSHELLSANSQMRALFQAIPDLLFRLDHDGTILDFKAGATGDLLLPAPELFGKRIQDIPVKSVGEQFGEAIARARQGNSIVTIEYSLPDRENYYEARLVPLPENQIVAIIRNITERRTAEALRTGQYRVLEMIAGGAPVPDTLAKLTRLIESQAKGMLCSVLLLDEDGQHLRHGAAPSLPDSYNKLVDGLCVGPKAGSCGTAAYRKEPVIVADVLEDPLWADYRNVAAQYGFRACWSSPIFSQSNQVLGTFAMYYLDAREPNAHEKRLIEIATQIAGIAIERKRTEAELHNSRQMLRTVLDTIPQRIFWKDRNSVYVGCNKPLAQDCGYQDPAELIGKTDYETVAADLADIYRADDRQVMETGQAKLNYEEPQTKADGTEGWLRTSKAPLYDKDGKVIGVLGTYEDITEVKGLEEQFRQSQKMEAFGQLAAGVAHDFNNILMVIQGYVSLLQMRNLPAADGTAAISGISHAVERAANLTRQLLTFSRRSPMQPRALDLNEVVVNMTKMLQRLIGEHIALEARYAPGGAPVQADSGMLEQVLVNLAVNSRDAMPKGGRLIIETSPAILTEAAVLQKQNARPGEFIRLSITDSGMGIAPENLPHIFEPFFTTKEIGKGTGLGLATVFGIVEQHRGWIDVESKPGAGTTFHVYLPRSTQAAVKAQVAPPPKVRGGNEAVLLVEDDSAVRELLRGALERYGYRVHEARSGAAALELWPQHRSDIRLLVTDMVMPEGINGRELADRLRKDKPALKVIYCSGYTDEMLGAESPLRHNVNFLEKPFDPNKFLQHVRDCLDER